MKSLIFSAVTVSMLLTVAQPISAQMRDDREGDGAEWSADVDVAPLHLDPHLNVLLGHGRLTTGPGEGTGGLSGGATIELGSTWRTAELGVLSIRTGGAADSRSLALPTYAKFRFVHQANYALFIKAGAMPAFETRSNRDAATRNLDVLLAGGLGARVKAWSRTDVVIDATYNRGLLDHSRARVGDQRDAGLLIFAGLSFAL